MDYNLCSTTVAGGQHIVEMFEQLSCDPFRTGVTLRINNHPVAWRLSVESWATLKLK
jgi:hypothetical protein